MPAGGKIIEFWEHRYLQSYGLMIERGGFGNGVQGKSRRTFQNTPHDDEVLIQSSLIVNVSVVVHYVSTKIAFSKSLSDFPGTHPNLRARGNPLEVELLIWCAQEKQALAALANQVPIPTNVCYFRGDYVSPWYRTLRSSEFNPGLAVYFNLRSVM